MRRQDLIHAELCYKVLGVLFDVWTRIGPSHRENFYQKAIATGLKRKGVRFAEQLPARLSYADEIVGIYYFDFLIEEKIVLEIKAREYFSQQDIRQLYGYLRAKNLQLGLLAHFTKSGVKFKRVVNLR